MKQPFVTAKPDENACDDLTMISGIGAARQKWLQAAFAVRTYADLAALSASEIAAQLKHDHKIVAADVIEDWLTQAGQLARQAGEQGKWKVFATFVVVFEEDGAGKYRTMVHHMESDHTEQWGDSEPHRMADWIGEQIGAKPQQTQEPALSPANAPLPESSVMELPRVTTTPHERLEELRAKVDRLRTHPQMAEIANAKPYPPIQHPVLPAAAQPYSVKLQKWLSKVQAIETVAPTRKR